MTTGNLMFYTFKALQPAPLSPSTQTEFLLSNFSKAILISDLPLQRTSEHYLFKPLDKGCHVCIL